MFPLHDVTPRERFPFVNYLLILINIGVFIVEIMQPDLDAFIHAWGFIPFLFSWTDPESYKYIISSMFLHGGLFHIAANLWFLHIFGDNVEDRMGHVYYLLFYLVGGVVATLVQYILIPAVNIPLIGASGAISAVAGAYLVMFSRSHIVAVASSLNIARTVQLPVWFFLIYWFALQLFYGVGSLTAINYNIGGTAWFAHIGGFIFGVAIGLVGKNLFRMKGM